MSPLPLYLAGTWTSGRGEPLASHNPVNNRVLAVVSTAGAADVDHAVAAGQAAMRNPAWRDLLPHQRAAFLHRIATLIERDAERLAQLQRQDNGKPILETRALVASAAGTFRYFAAVCETMEGDITPSRGNYLSLSTWEPLGVIAAITPWNSPIASEAQKVAPALAAGNAVIVKPSEFTPLLALELAKLSDEAGLPKGLLSVLPGTGASTGAALVAHPGIAKVTFTGGTATGRAIGRVAAEKIMPVSLELGGKSPNIVFADADLDQAINGVLFGLFSSQGQSCIAGSRIFIEESIYPAFTAKLAERVTALRIGDPVSERTQIGPLITPQHRDKVEGYVTLAREEGGRLLCGGTRPVDAALQAGNYFMPALIDGLNNRNRTAQEEIFGPVGVLLPFRDEDSLIAEANDSVYGLASGVWTGDFRRAWRIGRALNAGTVWINTYKQFSIATPFGGNAESGIGREKARDGLKAYMRQKSLYIDMSGRPIPWAD
ncbi:aldehyde dehydrogenase [Ferrovibrio sp.]|uniref:aldehyde dehydrogenase n=1 Tax=Ferrovibrio sp. TaxID=1917215 RepID=UPI0035111B30